MHERQKQSFPTRQYPYRQRVLLENASQQAMEDGEESTDNSPLMHEALYRFVLGLDAVPTLMADDEAATELRDPFAEQLLKRGIFPLTLRSLLKAIDGFNDHPSGLPQQKVFLVADGGQIPWSEATAQVGRFFRFAVVRLRGDDFGILVSASTLFDSEEQFLQVISWDPQKEVYHYYERRERAWVWAGHSHHALTEPTRGRGPFDSHVNGSLVMKELRFPWSHWHSDSARIHENVLAPHDPLRTESLFIERQNAGELEQFVVRPGIRRWNIARWKKAVRERPDGGLELHGAPLFMRQVLSTTTVNLASSPQESRLVAENSTVDLPITFFLNTEALLDFAGLAPDISHIRIPGRFYQSSLKRFDFALADDSGFRLEGDTHFAFLIPEPAFEDLDVLQLMLQHKVISPRFAAALLMVDFTNPVFSSRREQLLRYSPESADMAQQHHLEKQFVDAVQAAPVEAGTPEEEFLANYALAPADWRGEYEKRITDYFAKLTERATTPEGVDDFMRLAESRRREFNKRPLAEFRLTLPVTNIPLEAPPLRLRPDGTLEEVALSSGGPPPPQTPDSD